jgi:hypothetical protein
MQKAKLLKLAAYLDNLSPKKFNIGSWVRECDETKNKCGTVACAFGWCPVIFPRSNVKWTKDKDWLGDIKYTNKNGTFYDMEAASEFFGIDYEYAKQIFMGTSYPEYHQNGKDFYIKGSKGITPKRVARRIRHFVKTGEIK